MGRATWLSGAFAAWASLTAATPVPLDWSAPRRWVHIDTVDASRATVFEKARKDWLAALRRKAAWLPDGRPQFWSADRGAARVYLTFYPFRDFADLDEKARQTRATQAAVGEQAVADYDKGDVALVPPHHWEIWSPRSEYDFVPATDGLDERTAGAARIEMFEEAPGASEAAAARWREIAKGLAKARYPLTCRAWWRMYGNGQIARICFARTPTELSAIRQAAAVLPIRDSYVIERRPDLSNLSP